MSVKGMNLKGHQIVWTGTKNPVRWKTGGKTAAAGLENSPRLNTMILSCRWKFRLFTRWNIQDLFTINLWQQRERRPTGEFRNYLKFFFLIREKQFFRCWIFFWWEIFWKFFFEIHLSSLSVSLIIIENEMFLFIHTITIVSNDIELSTRFYHALKTNIEQRKLKMCLLGKSVAVSIRRRKNYKGKCVFKRNVHPRFNARHAFETIKM